MWDWLKRWKAKRAVKRISRNGADGFLLKRMGSKKIHTDKNTMDNIGPDGIWRPPAEQVAELKRILKDKHEHDIAD